MQIGKEQIRESVEAALRDPDKEPFICEGGVVVLMKDFKGCKDCQISWLAVNQELQGKGIGKKLVAFIENLALEFGFENVYVYTSDVDNDKARIFYSKLGYVKVDSKAEYYADGSAALLFRKKM